MCLDDELDLSDEMPSSESDDDDLECQKILEEKADAERVWNWRTDESPAPAFPIDATNDGRPASLPANSKGWKPIDFFFRMFQRRTFQLSTEETNWYASQNKHKQQGQVNHKWKQVTEHDIYKFISIILVLGVLVN